MYEVCIQEFMKARARKLAAEICIIQYELRRNYCAKPRTGLYV
jgi:hypothetical protein